MLNSRNKTAILGPALVAGAAAAPWAGEMASNYQQRYAKTLNDITTARQKQPGDRLVTASAKSFTEKRATLQSQTKTAGPVKGGGGGFIGKLVGPFASAAKPIVDKVLNFAHKHPLAVGGGIFGLTTVAPLLDPTIGAYAEKIKDHLVPSNQEDTMWDQATSSLATSAGSAVGSGIAEGLGGLAGKGFSGIANLGQDRARMTMFDKLRKGDDVLSEASPAELQSAYHTMVTFAPSLATDPNAVRSFLREAVLYGTGPNVVSIKQLADTEKTIQNLGQD